MNRAERAAVRAGIFINILRSQGVALGEGAHALDLGCGAGHLVKALRNRGLDSYGCGLGLRDPHYAAEDSLVQQGILREITTNPYRIPFDDHFFDVVISNQVFEHVMDYPTMLREIHRVLTPGGAFLHIFPSRYKFIEPHMLVPLGGVLRSRWWLKSWALVGIRNEFQRKLSAAQTCEANRKYLTTRTNYLSKRELQRQFSRFYTDVRFVEDAFLQNSTRGRKIHEMGRWLPFLPSLYSAVRCRAVFGRRGASPAEGVSLGGSSAVPR